MIEKYDDGEIINPDELDSYHIFHETHRDNVQSIIEDGFEPKFDRSQENDEKYVNAVAKKLGRSYPVDRENASFFYSDFDSVSSRASYGGYTIVVDARKLNYPVYMAEVELYDDIFDNAPHMDRVDELDDRQLDLGRKYLDSLESIRSVNNISSTARGYTSPELIIDSHIPKDAIIGFIRL